LFKTHKQFWVNPYQTALQTHIMAVDGASVQVAESIFYAFSGGQESDIGTFNGLPVLEARKNELAIHYILPPEHGLHVGDALEMRIDWTRRYRLMRLHFAAELILELSYRQLGKSDTSEAIAAEKIGTEKIGAHIAADKARIDFEWPQNLTPLLPILQAQASELIAADHPILSTFSDEARERRTWEIEGFAKVACGGTHLKRTGEVGALTLKRKNVGKNKERIEIYLQQP